MENGINFFKDYFMTCAINHKIIAHGTNNRKSFVFELFDDLIDRDRNLDYPALIVTETVVRLNDYRASQVSGIVKGSFAILKSVGKNDSPEDKEAVIDECNEIARDIISKMYKDRKKFEFNDLNINAFNISVMDQVNGDCLAVLVDYEFEKPIDLKFEINNWNNEVA